MAILSPSILAADPMNMQKDLENAAQAGAKWLHIDVMDGSFVPNLSFGYSTVKAVNGISDLVLDVHLMIEKPIRYVEHFCKAGSDILTIHVEADTPENTKAALEQIRAMGVKPGIVLKPKTPAEALAPYLSMVDLVLVMTVEPGFGGQSFMADQLPKIAAFRKEIVRRNLNCHIEVDGGIGEKNVDLVVGNGANVIVAGTSVFRHPAGMAAGVKVLHDAQDKLDSAL
jgi:ribulose-phosphate 3-epimerase